MKPYILVFHIQYKQDNHIFSLHFVLEQGVVWPVWKRTELSSRSDARSKNIRTYHAFDASNESIVCKLMMLFVTNKTIVKSCISDIHVKGYLIL